MTTQITSHPVAPLPRRSRRRRYVLGGLAVLFVVPVVYYFIAGWLADRQMEALTRAIDEEDPTWRWHDLIAAQKLPPDGQNSGLQIAKVHDLLKVKNPLSAGGKWENAPLDDRNVRLGNEYLEPLRKAFDGVPKEAIAEARRLKDMPDGGFALTPDENPFSMKLDHIQNSREVANLLQWDAILRAHDDDVDGAAESCRAILCMARALKDQPFLISVLVRIAEQAIAIYNLERTLALGTVSETELQKLQALLEAEAAEDGLHHAMRGERAAGHQTYLNLRSGKTTFSELLGLTNLKIGLDDRLLDAFPGIILSGYPEFLTLMNEQVRISKLKDAERAEAFDALEKKVRQQRSNFLIGLIMPATSKVAEATQRSQAMLRCASVAVAAERYRLRHDGAWPRGLDDLVKAELLKEVPRDPYDGKPLRFKRTPTGVLVYSVGLDKTDNGGKLNRANPRAPGADLGFELWDPKQRGLPAP